MPTRAKVLAEPAVKKRMEQLGVVVVGSTPAELGAHLKSEIELWGPSSRPPASRARTDIMLDRRRFTRLPQPPHCRPRSARHRPCPGADLAEPQRAPGRAVHARRRHRRHRPHRRRAAVGDLGPAGRGREQARRRRQYRHRVRRARSAPDGYTMLHHRRRARGQPVPVPVDQLRSGRRLRAGHADLPVSQPAGRAEGSRSSARSATSSHTPRQTRAS